MTKTSTAMYLRMTLTDPQDAEAATTPVRDWSREQVDRSDAQVADRFFANGGGGILRTPTGPDQALTLQNQEA